MYKLLIVENKTLTRNDEKKLKHIAGKHIGYMEISEEAKGFACGSCRSLNDKEFCENPEVQAYVSAKHGCCNYFYPDKAKVNFPKEEKGDGKSRS